MINTPPMDPTPTMENLMVKKRKNEMETRKYVKVILVLYRDHNGDLNIKALKRRVLLIIGLRYAGRCLNCCSQTNLGDPYYDKSPL